MTKPTFPFVVVLQIETSDPRLTEESMVELMKTARGHATMRAAILQHLPKDVRRLIAVMPVEQARALMMLQDEINTRMGIKVNHAPADYVPPTMD